MGGSQTNKPSWGKAGTNNNVNVKSYNYITKLVPTITEDAVSDSGFTSHLIQPYTPCEEKTPTITWLCVGIPNGAVLQESHDDTLNLDHLPVRFSTKEKSTYVLPDLANKSLLSLGQLCHNGCYYILPDKKYVSFIIYGATTIIGTRDTNNRLWSVDLTNNGTPLSAAHPSYAHMANSVCVQKNKTKLLDFLHWAVFRPTVYSCTKAFNNNFFETWPSLTEDYVQNFLSDSINTAKGHMKTAPKHLWSTKPSPPIQHEFTIVMTPTSPPVEPPVQTHIVYPRVVELTGKFISD